MKNTLVVVVFIHYIFMNLFSRVFSMYMCMPTYVYYVFYVYMYAHICVLFFLCICVCPHMCTIFSLYMCMPTYVYYFNYHIWFPNWCSSLVPFVLLMYKCYPIPYIRFSQILFSNIRALVSYGWIPKSIY
jgi:hypothetical protein